MSEKVDTKSLHESIDAIRESFESSEKNNKASNTSMEEKLSNLSGEQRDKFEKASAVADKLESKNQELTLAVESEQKEKKEINERMENLENQIIKGSRSGNIDIKELPEYKAFNELVQKGMEHKDYLRTDKGPDGGFLVPDMISETLLKQITEISGVRSLARVRTTKTKTLNIPIRTSLPISSYEGESESAASSTSKYISETMTAHRHHVIVPITRDQLNYSAFNMESEIQSDVSISMAQSEGNKYLLGTSVKEPEGILSRVDTGGANEINSVESALSGAVSMDDVIQLPSSMKIGYNLVYFFNMNTLGVLRTEKDSNGNYLWRIGGESQPSEINGLKYVIMQDMPSIAINSLSVGVGDFFNGYNILDSIQMELIRDDVTQKAKAIVEFSWNRYNDGRVVLGEAFKILKTKA